MNRILLVPLLGLMAFACKDEAPQVIVSEDDAANIYSLLNRATSNDPPIVYDSVKRSNLGQDPNPLIPGTFYQLDTTGAYVVSRPVYVPEENHWRFIYSVPQGVNIEGKITGYELTNGEAIYNPETGEIYFTAAYNFFEYTQEDFTPPGGTSSVPSPDDVELFEEGDPQFNLGKDFWISGQLSIVYRGTPEIINYEFNVDGNLSIVGDDTVEIHVAYHQEYADGFSDYFGDIAGHSVSRFAR